MRVSLRGRVLQLLGGYTKRGIERSIRHFSPSFRRGGESLTKLNRSPWLFTSVVSQRGGVSVMLSTRNTSRSCRSRVSASARWSWLRRAGGDAVSVIVRDSTPPCDDSVRQIAGPKYHCRSSINRHSKQEQLGEHEREAQGHMPCHFRAGRIQTDPRPPSRDCDLALRRQLRIYAAA